MVETAVERWGRLDLLILCAGISAHCQFEDFTDMKPFKKVMDVNYYGVVYPTRHALKYLKHASP